MAETREVDLLIHGGRFDRGEYVGTAIFVLALLAILARRRRGELLVAIGAAAYIIAWREESPQAAKGCRGDPAAATASPRPGAATARPTAARSPRSRPKAGEETPQHAKGCRGDPTAPPSSPPHRPTMKENNKY